MFVVILGVPRPFCLGLNGKLLRRSMPPEFLISEELMVAIRNVGADDLLKVEKACLEADGEVSVVKRS